MGGQAVFSSGPIEQDLTAPAKASLNHPKFFGLFTSYQESCTGEELFLGTTPLKPIELPEGGYVLRIPPDFAWEHQGPIKVNVAAQQKTFFLLKLFKRRDPRVMGGPGGPGGASGGSGGGGSGTGGGVGSSPP